MKKIYLYIIFIFLYSQASFADLIKPNNEIDPTKVVVIQLSGLKNNDSPSRNYGIKQTWEFAHPSNKKYTGPLSKFINLLQSESYKMLINHLDSEIVEVFKSANKYGFEVTILAEDKKYYEDGPLKDCWLTTSVSNPISLGSSI